MKYWVLCLLLLPVLAFGQDKLTLRTGQVFDGIVTNINSDKLYFIKNKSDSVSNQRPIKLEVLQSIYIDNAAKYQSLLSINPKLKSLVKIPAKNNDPNDPYLKRVEPKASFPVGYVEEESRGSETEYSTDVVNASPLSEKYAVFNVGYLDAITSPRTVILVDTGTFKNTGASKERIWRGADRQPLQFLSTAHALNFLNSKGWELIQSWQNTEASKGILIGPGYMLTCIMRKRIKPL